MKKIKNTESAQLCSPNCIGPIGVSHRTRTHERTSMIYKTESLAVPFCLWLIYDPL